MSPYQESIQLHAKYAATSYDVNIFYWFPNFLRASDKMPNIHCARENRELHKNNV